MFAAMPRYLFEMVNGETHTVEAPTLYLATSLLARERPDAGYASRVYRATARGWLSLGAESRAN